MHETAENNHLPGLLVDHSSVLISLLDNVASCLDLLPAHRAKIQIAQERLWAVLLRHTLVVVTAEQVHVIFEYDGRMVRNLVRSGRIVARRLDLLPAEVL